MTVVYGHDVHRPPLRAPTLALLAYIESFPGGTTHDLCRHFGIDAGRLASRLTVLIDRGLINQQLAFPPTLTGRPSRIGTAHWFPSAPLPSAPVSRGLSNSDPGGRV